MRDRYDVLKLDSGRPFYWAKAELGGACVAQDTGFLNTECLKNVNKFGKEWLSSEIREINKL